MIRVRFRVQASGQRRVGSLLISLAIHVLLIAAALRLPVEPPAPPRETRASLEKKFTIVWYPPRKLPEVSPQPKSSAQDAIPRPLPEAPRTVLSTLAEARPRKQLIFQQIPAPKLQQEIPAPNIIQLSMAMPAVPPPPPPKPTPKAFTAPAPQAAPPPPTAPVLTAAPSLATVDNPKLVLPAASLSQIEAPKPAARPFVAPAARASAAPAGPTTVELPSAPSVGNADKNALNTLVVGLNPLDQLKAPLPPGNLPGQVSAQRNETVKSAASDSGGGVLAAANVIVRENRKEPSPALPQPRRASPEERAKAAARATLSAPLYPSSRVLPPLIEAYFARRTAYTCLLEGLPGIPASAMWFSEVAAAGPNSPLIRAPVLARAEPLPANASDSPQKIYLALTIGPEGMVKNSKVLAASNNPLGQSLQDLSAQWEFAPATRNGRPVEVEAILELTFGPPARVSAR